MLQFNRLREAERPGGAVKTLELRRGEDTVQIEVPAQGLGWGEDGVGAEFRCG